MKFPNEQGRATRAVAPANGAAVPDHDGAAAEVSSGTVDPVAVLNLVVLRQRRPGSRRRLRWRREVGLGRRYARGRNGHPWDAYLLLRGWDLRWRRREGVCRWMLLRLRLGRWRQLLLLVLILLRRRDLLGRRRWRWLLVGGVEEAVADVDVVVEVVEVVVVAVVLVDVLYGGDSLAAVERRVAVGVHGGGGRASSRVRVFRIRVGGGRGTEMGLFSWTRGG